MAALTLTLCAQNYPKLFFQKGVNFTAEFPEGYLSADAGRMLRALPKYGVNAVALVPYGFTPTNSTRVRLGGGMESDESVERLARLAHSLKIKVMLKPQVWVGGGRYPGDLEFASDVERKQWFAEYRKFVEHYARLAAAIHADIYCIGVEFAKLARYSDEWRGLIARARAIYAGPITYAANSGPEFENLTFWADLDYIGLNDYYPLPDNLSTDNVLRKVEAVQRKYRRPVIFTEVGFSSFAQPHREPWAETPRDPAPEAQARCYEAVFRAFYRQPWFEGMYWWKVGTDGSGGPLNGSHTPWQKPAMEVLKRWYSGAGIR